MHLSSHPRTANFLVLTLFVISAFAVYLPAIGGPFVFDDTSNILHNPAIRMSELSLAAIGKAAAEGFISSRPVANISFAFNYLLGRDDPTGYHVANIIIHAVTAFLLFLLLRVTLMVIDRAWEWKEATLISLVAAWLWLLHPIQSQTVAYVVQRMTSMAAMFYLLAMLGYAYGRQATGRGQKTAFFTGAGLAGLAAMASKESAAMLPFFILLYEWYFFQDLSRGWLKKRPLPILAVMGAFLAAALFFLGQDPVGRILAGYEIRNFSLVERLLTELRVVVFYLGQLLYPAPSRLSLEHDFPISQSLLAPPTTIFAALFLAVLLFLAVKLAGRRRLFSFAILWYLGNLLIESSVIGLEIIFEHRNYLPSMFVVVALVTIVDRLIKPAKAKIALTLGVALIFSFWTYQRSRVWGDEELLIRDSLGKAPNSFRLHYNLGTVISADGRHAEAIEAYYRALQVYPRDSNTRRAQDLNLVYTNLGNALSRTGKFIEADKAYYQALRYNPGDGYAYLGLGINFLQAGKYELSEHNFRKALLTTNDPTVHFEIRIGLGLASWRQGRLDEALGHYQAALRLQPGSTRVQGYIVELQKANRSANQSD